MTRLGRRARGGLAALGVGLVSCGYYAPPIRPEAEPVTPDTAEDAPQREDRPQHEESGG